MKITKKHQSNQNSKKNLGDNQNSNKEIGCSDINKIGAVNPIKVSNYETLPQSVKNTSNMKWTKVNGQGQGSNYQSHNFNPSPEVENKTKKLVIPEHKRNHKRVSSEKVEHYDEMFASINTKSKPIRRIQEDNLKDTSNRSKSQNNSMINNEKDKNSIDSNFITLSRINDLKNPKLAPKKKLIGNKDKKLTHMLIEPSATIRKSVFSPKEGQRIFSNKSVDKLNQSFSNNTKKQIIPRDKQMTSNNPIKSSNRPYNDNNFNRSCDKPRNINEISSNANHNNITIKLDKLKKTLQSKQRSQQMNFMPETDEQIAYLNREKYNDSLKKEIMFNGNYPYTIRDERENEKVETY